MLTFLGVRDDNIVLVMVLIMSIIVFRSPFLL